MAEPMFDVVVVGAGPAGLGAAVHAAEAGASVALVDAGRAPGGQYWRQPAGQGGLRPAHVAYLHHDLRTYRDLVERLDRAREQGAIVYRAQHHVWTVSAAGSDGFVVHAVDHGSDGDALVEVGGRRIVLATGAYDRQIPFPGWDLPGVMTAGGVQALLKEHHVQAGRRILVAGTGPFLLSVAAGLASSGATVVGVHEAAAPRRWASHVDAVRRNPGKIVEGLGYVGILARHRVPVHTRSTVVAAHGETELEAVTVGRLAADGVLVGGSEYRVEVDTLAVGWGFTPQIELARTLGCRTWVDHDGSEVCVIDGDQSTSVPGVFVAGELCGVGGAELAVLEGTVAGRIAGSGNTGSSTGDQERRRRGALRRFAVAMQHAHPVPPGWAERLSPETVVCRCEEVTVAGLRTAVDDLGAADGRDAKLLSRPGMGWCQGRVCGYATASLTATWSGQPYTPGSVGARPVASPVRLGDLASTCDDGD